MRPATSGTIATLTLVCLYGCGGGGGSSTTPATSQSAAAPASTPPAAEQSPPPAAEQTPSTPPEIDFAAADTVVLAGGETSLSWTSANSTSCRASGDWSGPKATTGSETVGPLQARATYTLTCANGGENAVAMLSVDVRSTITIEWIPPTKNTDDSDINDLAGFRIYRGTASRTYDDHLEIDDPAATQYDVSLRSGRHFVSMTALDTAGNESTFSNEIERVAP